MSVLNVVGYYDLSVLSMSVMGWQKSLDTIPCVCVWCELYPNYFWIFGICLTLLSPFGDNGIFIHYCWQYFGCKIPTSLEYLWYISTLLV